MHNMIGTRTIDFRLLCSRGTNGSNDISCLASGVTSSCGSKEPWKYLRTMSFSPQEMGPWMGVMSTGWHRTHGMAVISNLDLIGMFCSVWNMKPNK